MTTPWVPTPDQIRFYANPDPIPGSVDLGDGSMALPESGISLQFQIIRSQVSGRPYVRWHSFQRPNGSRRYLFRCATREHLEAINAAILAKVEAAGVQ